jgi:hypothetical protein
MYKLPAGNKVVIDDVRFPNEADKIRHGWNGVVVRLAGGVEGDMHESEQLVDRLDVTWDLPAYSFSGQVVGVEMRVEEILARILMRG